MRAPSALPLKAERHPNTKHQSYSDPRSPPAPAPAPAPPPSYRWVRRPPRSQAPYAPPLSSWTPPTTAAHTVQRLHLHCLPLPTRHHRQGASPRRIVQRTLDPPAFNNTHSVWCTHTHSAAHLHPHCLSPRHIMQRTHDPLAFNTRTAFGVHTRTQCSTSIRTACYFQRVIFPLSESTDCTKCTENRHLKWLHDTAEFSARLKNSSSCSAAKVMCYFITLAFICFLCCFFILLFLWQ